MIGLSVSRHLACLACALSCAAPARGVARLPQPVGQSGGWRLVFADDFDEPRLDPRKWTTCFPWAIGDRGCRNDTTPELWYSPGNVVVGGGVVRLQARRERTAAEGKTYQYTSGMIATAGRDGPASHLFTLTYGYLEIRARMPSGRGLWPAFWTLPTQGDCPPEIDVVELLGHRPRDAEMHFHFRDASGAHRDHGGAWTGPDFSAGFHVFAVAWEPGALRWYVDGVERQAAFTDARFVPREPMYLVANLQVGGDWPGEPDATTRFPAELVIDYVRVWHRDPPAPRLPRL